jgi:hypothetical protein
MKNIAWVAVLGLALTTVGCGDEPPAAGPGGPPAGPKRKKAAAAVEAVETVKRVQNPKWDVIDSYFEKFANQPLLTHKDTFRDNLVKHVPKVDLPVVEPEVAAPEVQEPETPVVDEVAAGPLERYATEEYKLIMILSGTVVPKALVVDPIGNTWIVQKDARFGNKSGIVQNITQYAMIVQEPDKDQPIEKTIKPPIFEVASDFTTTVTTDEQKLTSAPLR